MSQGGEEEERENLYAIRAEPSSGSDITNHKFMT